MREGRSFLEDKSKVTGITDVLSRMGATEAVDHEAKVTSDDQARSLLNRFLGAQVLMSGVESMMASSSLAETARVDTDRDGKASVTQSARGVASTTSTRDGEVTHHQRSAFTSTPTTTTLITSSCKGVEAVLVSGVDINEVNDEAKLNQLLDTCGEYEERRKIRMRLKSLMAEKKAQQGEVSGHGRGAGQVEAGGAKAAGGGAAGSGGVGEGDKGTVSPFGASTELRTGQAESKTVSPFEKFKKLDSKQSPRPAKE